MPLSIGAVWLLGWWGLGLAPATALLLGAVLAPTDPVLAGDVQVGAPASRRRPRKRKSRSDERHEVRFALTSEAGLNDGLAFPFVYAAIFLLEKGTSSLARPVGGVGAGGQGGDRLAGRRARGMAAREPGVPRPAGLPAPGRARRAVAGPGGAGDVVRRCRAGRWLRLHRGVLLRDGHAQRRAKPRLQRGDARRGRAPGAAAHPAGAAVPRDGDDPRSARRPRLARSRHRNGADPAAAAPDGALSLLPFPPRARDGPPGAVGGGVLRGSRRGLPVLPRLRRGAGRLRRRGWLWATVAFTIGVSVLVHGVLAKPATGSSWQRTASDQSPADCRG